MARRAPDPSARLHLVVGAEPGGVETVLEQIREAHGVGEGSPQWEELRLDGSEQDAERIHGALAGGSLFASHRLVLLRRVEEVPPEVQEVLVALVDPLPPGVVLVLTASRRDGRTGLFKALKAAETWDLTPPDRAADLARWVEEQARAQGVTLSKAAVQRLLEVVGGEAALIPGELAKLATYASDGAPVTPEVVDALASTAWPGLPRYAVFDLVDAVSRGDAAMALTRFRTLLRRGEEPLRLLAMLGRQLHLLGVARGLQARGEGRPEALMEATAIKSPFEARKILQLATQWDEVRLAQAAELAAEADEGMKKGASAPTTMELLVLALCRLSRGTSPGPS